MKKTPRYFKTYDAMRDVLLEHGSRLTLRERLLELNRLNRIAFLELFEQHKPRKTRFRMHVQLPHESLTTFFSRISANTH